MTEKDQRFPDVPDEEEYAKSLELIRGDGENEIISDRIQEIIRGVQAGIDAALDLQDSEFYVHERPLGFVETHTRCARIYGEALTALSKFVGSDWVPVGLEAAFATGFVQHTLKILELRDQYDI